MNVALCWAKNRLLVEQVETEGIDISFVKERLSEIETKLRVFAQLRTECTNAERAIDRIRSYATEIQEGIKTEVDSLNNELISLMEEQ